MIRRPNNQLSILDGAFNNRNKRSRTDKLLAKIDEFVDWDPLVELAEGVFKDTRRGRPTIPVLFSIKSLFLQYLYGLSDPGLEDALTDRLSFQRFVGLGFETEVPDFTTLWRFRERLVKSGLHDKLFNAILEQLEARRLILRRGTLVDAIIVKSARKFHKGEKENTSQQDHDAGWTKKGKKSHYGYKGHIGADEGSNIIRKQRMTSASIHDSQLLDEMISGDEKSVFADKAYSSDGRKQALRKKGIYCGILDKGRRNRALSPKQMKMNRRKSAVRNSVERPFAHFRMLYGYWRVRYMSIERNACHFVFLCMIHNIRRGIALTAS